MRDARHFRRRFSRDVRCREHEDAARALITPRRCYAALDFSDAFRRCRHAYCSPPLAPAPPPPSPLCRRWRFGIIRHAAARAPFSFSPSPLFFFRLLPSSSPAAVAAFSSFSLFFIHYHAIIIFRAMRQRKDVFITIF